MKKLLYIIVLISFLGCDYNRFDAPETPFTTLEANTMIDDLNDMSGKGPIRYEYIISGVVTSCDSAGNFYKQLYVQDQSGAIELRLGIYDIFSLYNRFDSVSVKLGGLSIGRYCGALQVGYGKSGSQYVDPLTSVGLIGVSVFRQIGRNDKIAQLVQADKIDLSMAGQIVLVDGVFVNQGTSKDRFDGKQPFESNGFKVTVYTSPYASFANERLPHGNVRIRAIVTFDTSNKLQLKLSNPSDVSSLF